MSAWIHWILTGLVPLCLSVALWFALIEIRGLRERADALEDVSRRLVAVYGDIADAINRNSKTTATALNGNAQAINDFVNAFTKAMWGSDSAKETDHD